MFVGLIAVLCGLSITACGGKASSEPSSGSHPAPKHDGPSPVSTTLPLAKLKGDSEDDESTRNQTVRITKNDNDADFDNDKFEERGYFDKDDSRVRSFGHPADAADLRALTSLVARYFAAAVSEDGVTACSMLHSVAVEAFIEGYRGTGHLNHYVLQGKTCPEIMTNLFRHYHAQLTIPARVVAARVQGDQAAVFLGSTVMPASVMSAKREGGAWTIDSILDRPMA